MSSHGSYIPPFRRGDVQATNATPDASEPHYLPPNYSSPHQFFKNGGNRGYTSGRGFRGGRDRGHGRGRGTYGNHFSQNRNQQDKDKYHSQRAIITYFRGEETDYIAQSSTFHDSKEHPGQLSCMLLFHNANPRWPDDGIVFAKSRLNLLPEYSVKTEEYGEWPTVKQPESPQGSDATVDATTKESMSQSATKDDEAGHVVTAIKSLSVTDEEKAETTTPSESTDADETPAEEISLGSSNRMKCSDIRNLPQEEQEHLMEDQKQRRWRSQELPQFAYISVPPIEYAPSTHAAIAAFEERHSFDYGNNKSIFVFAGWYRIIHISILAPCSEELVRMQRQKWERRDRYGNVLPGKARDAAAWKESLETTWAVVKFEKIGEDEAPAVPDIETLPKLKFGRPPEKIFWGKARGERDGAAEKNLEGDAEVKEDVGGKEEDKSASTEDDKKALADDVRPEEAGTQPEPVEVEAKASEGKQVEI
ncbi:hypothetical protein F4811DRAFT_84762 [Daldinia bambusicola]|nr:hypothetical protein F4811DRAFT_84762 [Daldinia bambusicola]